MGLSLPPQPRRVGLGSGERAAESSAAACVPHRSRIARELCDEKCGCRQAVFRSKPNASVNRQRHHTRDKRNSIETPGPFVGLPGLRSRVNDDAKL